MPMTNEQKLDEIYQYIRKQQWRELRAKVYRVFYIFAIIGIAYYVSQNPGIVMKKVTDLVMPAIMENMESQMMWSGWLIEKFLPKQ